MRYINIRRSHIFLLVALAFLGSALACTLPFSLNRGKDLSQEEALELVLEKIVKPDQLGDDPTVIFALSQSLGPDDELYAYSIFGDDDTPKLAVIKSESWFFWIEDEPYAYFSHSSRFVLVNIDSGKISSSEESWWPMLNGEALWAEDEDYKNEENWAWSNISFQNPDETSGLGTSSVMAAMRPPGRELTQDGGGKRRALVINTVTEEQRGEDDGVLDAKNMLKVLDRTDFKSTYMGTDYDKNSRNTGDPFPTGNETDPWREWLDDQSNELTSGDTLVVYVGGHGDSAGSGGGIGSEDGVVGSAMLSKELKKFNPGVDIIVILQACKSGSFVNDLKDVADLTMTSTNATFPSFGDLDFAVSLISPVLGTDLNPLDEGSEYISSLVSGWLGILDDPELLEEVKQRAKDEGISFMDALISQAYEEGSIYDLPARLQWSHPQTEYGSKKTKPADPTGTPIPTITSTPEPTPTSKEESRFNLSLGDYKVSMAPKKDDGGHKGFIGMPGTIKLTVKKGSIKIEGPFPFVTVTGEMADDGTISASGQGTVAGYGNVQVTFQGSISDGHMEGDYVMGASGGLPGGRSITYGLSGDKLVPTPTPTPDPRVGKVNGFFEIYNARFEAGDAAGLLALLHPEVLELYGSDVCLAYLTDVVENPVVVEPLQLESSGPWTWEIDERSIAIGDTYTVQVSVSAGGQTTQQSLHLGILGDGSLTWFTDCGDPLP